VNETKLFKNDVNYSFDEAVSMQQGKGIVNLVSFTMSNTAKTTKITINSSVEVRNLKFFFI
jgi:hypothetical protein